MKSLAPPGYHTVELDVPVPGVEPVIFRWKWRAERKCRKWNAGRPVDSYRYEVQHNLGRWWVVVMQNQLQPDEQNIFNA